MRITNEFRVCPLGDSAVVVRLGNLIEASTHRAVMRFGAALETQRLPGVTDVVPAFTSVTVHYNPLQISYEDLVTGLQAVWRQPGKVQPDQQNVVEIPVCYGGEYGPDLSVVAAHTGLTEAEVIQIHAAETYLVYMIGFAPGFPYLGGLSKLIATPRKDTPRMVIPAGSVGIAGEQTGVYPIATPGGWQVIGRTPVPLFQPHRQPPTLLKAGDLLRFRPISQAQYEQLEAQLTS